MLDWMSIQDVGEDYEGIQVVLSPTSRSILYVLVTIIQNRGWWRSGDDEPSDEERALIKEALSDLENELTTVIDGEECPDVNIEIAQYKHKTATGVNGGSAAAATANIRPLTETIVQPAWASRADNIVTLQPGRFLATLRETGYQTGQTRAGIWPTDESPSNIKWGNWVNLPPDDYIELSLGVDVYFDLAEETDLAAVQFATVAQATNGLGIAQVATENIYAILTIMRLGD